MRIRKSTLFFGVTSYKSCVSEEGTASVVRLKLLAQEAERSGYEHLPFRVLPDLYARC
jgi:hypothetical protein